MFFNDKIKTHSVSVSGLDKKDQEVIVCTNAAEALHQVQKNGGTDSDVSGLRFYLSSIGQRWNPYITLVKQDGALTGIVCMKEKSFGPLRTGLLFADAHATDLVMAAPEQVQSVWALTLSVLFEKQKIRGLRLFAAPDAQEIKVASLIADTRNLVMKASLYSHHDELPLPENYDAFRNEVISPKLRKNLNFFRNKAAREGHVFHRSIPFEEFQAAALEMLDNKQIRNNPVSLLRGLNIAAHASKPILAGLRHENGKEWLSLILGWYHNGQAWTYGQLNREYEYPKSSLRLVTLGNLVEKLIEERQVKSVVIWGGTSGPLERACRPLANTAVHIDTPVFHKQARVLSKVLLTAAPHMPAKIRSSIYNSVKGNLSFS